ncbi:hypothetical protein FSARC_12152 [Fusarium sarcochroum]|uniref:Zn(2)-C6 fungal-type domain-containing protein n=1 Tax=Fusarium sarcochroum TaxID=1208366 RepID=A0A8H4TAG5_9HYPO|nr:hypothetical protein FSARC_12152 [Fusarium sarcochroum]
MSASQLPRANWSRITSSKRLYRSSQAVSAIGQDVYIFGGELVPRQPVDNRVDVVTLGNTQDHGAQTLSTPVNAPSPRVGSPSTDIGNDLLLFSGRGGLEMKPIEEKGALWRYKVSENEWDLIEPADSSASFPAGRSYHCLASDGVSQIYLHSGCPEQDRLSDFWVFDLEKRTWTELASAPAPARGGSSIAFLAGNLYRMNGFDGKTEQGGTLDVYNIKAGDWSAIQFKPDGAEGPEARSVATLLPVSVQSKTYLITMFGERDPSALGHAGAGKMLSDVWAFDVEQNIWQMVETAGDVPAARGWFDADVTQDEAVDDIVVVHGGLGEDNQRLGDVWALRFSRVNLKDSDFPMELGHVKLHVIAKIPTITSGIRAMPPKRACDVCFQRKIQCIKQNTDLPCEWCSDHDLECAVKREPQKKTDSVSAILGEVQALTRRVVELETALGQIRSAHGSSVDAASSFSGQKDTPVSGSGTTDSAETHSPFHISPQAERPAARVLGQCFGQHWYFKGIPILSDKGRKWMLSRTGETSSLENFHLFGSQPGFLPSASNPHQQGLELPDRQTTETILGSYLDSPWQRIYPVLDPVLVRETIALAYPGPESAAFPHRQVSAKACVLASLSMVSRFKGLEDPLFPLRSDIYADAVQGYLPYILNDTTMEILQTILMLQIYRMLSGQWENATTLHSFACRIVYDLKGHRFHPITLVDPPNLHDQRRHEHIRSLFWLCYIFDKDISIRYGRPPSLTRDYCDLTLPEGLTKIYDSSSPGSSQIENQEAVAYFPQDLHLSQIKEKICLFRCSLDNSSLSDGEILRHARQLDLDLENWRLSIPVDYRPKLSDHPPFQPHMSFLQRRRCTHLQLEYHYLTTVIHTAVRRCGAAYTMTGSLPDEGNLPEDLHSVYHSSSDLSLEASRTTLQMFKNHENLLEEDIFG